MYRLLTLIFFIHTFSFAQKPGLVFHNLSVNDGLSSNYVWAIMEDHKGYMWFGTEDGLNKYDGYKFTIYKNEKADTFSISNREIRFLYKDKKNNLWIVANNSLNLYDPLLDKFYNFKNNKYPVLKYLKGNVKNISEDSKGNLWVVTLYDGLYKINSLINAPEKFIFTSKDNNKQFKFLLPESDTSFLVGTKDGLLRFNLNSKKFSDLRQIYGSGYEVTSMYKDVNGNFWICSTKGLRCISKDGKMKLYIHNPSDTYSINKDNIIGIIPYKKDNYLIGIEGGGIDYLDVKNQKFYHYQDELSSNNVNSIYADSKGDAWVGTFLNGINFSNSTTNLFVLSKNNLFSDINIKDGIITSFLKDKRENLWIATDGGGLYRKDKGTNKFIQYKQGTKGLSSNAIISLVEDKDGSIWLTTYGGGLCRYDYQKDAFKVFHSDPTNPNSLFIEDTKALLNYENKIWVSGFGAGIGVYDKQTDKFIHYKSGQPNSIPSDWIQSFYADKNGTLWLGTFNGLSKYESQSQSFKNFLFRNLKNINQEEINIIMDLHEDSEGNMWLGTMGGLICFNRSNGNYEVYTTENGLSNNYIKSIIEDNQKNLWLSTDNGITKFNILSRKSKAYTIKDGIPPCFFYLNSKYKDEEGKIYFGAEDGYLIIDPKMAGENNLVPPIVLTNFKIFNQSAIPGISNSPLHSVISETKEIVLPYNQNFLTFEFAALNFNGTRSNKYAYWLEGFDHNWFMSDNQRTATYTNLNPGTYIFHVKGSNNDNVWNETGTSVIIIINPPFWKTWWFECIIGLLFILILYLLYLWRTSLIRNKNILLEETVRKRTIDLKEAIELMEMFVNKASHDIKGPLKSIIGLTTIGKKDVSAGGDASFYFDHILSSTTKLDNLVQDLLQVSRVKQAKLVMEKIDFRKIIEEVQTSFANFPGYEKMTFKLEIDEQAEFSSDRKMLSSIIQNLIENPIKYSDPEKEVNILNIKIEVTAKGETTLIFKDNGIGIPKEFIPKIFDMFFKVNEKSNGTGLGLFIVKTSVERLRGTIDLDSELGKGSTFTVKFASNKLLPF